MLLHQHQLDRLQTMKVVHSRPGVRHPRYAPQRQESLAGEIVRRQHVVIHNGEGDHSARRPALLEADAELEALVKDRVQRLLVDVGLLLVAVAEDTVRQQLDYHEWVAETVRVEGDDVAGMEDLREKKLQKAV